MKKSHMYQLRTIAILLHLFGLLAPPESTLKFVAFMGLPFSLDPERENACSALISMMHDVISRD